MKTNNKRVLAIILAFAVMIGVAPAGAGGPWTSTGDVLHNGSFEQGFLANTVCGGMVGTGWGCFHNGGTAAYGFYDDMWDAVVHAGEHSQLIEINTKEIGGDGNRNAGIYQTVNVWPGSQYELSLKGMIRADDRSDDPWRYRVYVGFDQNGGSNWQAVTSWQELPWDTYYDRLSPGAFSSYTTKVVPHSGKLTVFIRVERKWGTWYEETDFNLDSISLVGPTGRMPYDSHRDDGYDHGKDGYDHGSTWHDGGADSYDYDHGHAYPMPHTDSGHSVTPPAALVCAGANVLMNGNFESGFQPSGVANYWVGFNNGGHANFGYYDEMWERVVSEGRHGQLLEINTLDVGDATEANRISGIYQRVRLVPGATYELSFDSLMRERTDHSDEDFYRYMVEWGFSKDGGIDPSKMDHWERVPLETITLRTDPGAMQPYRVRFVAPSKTTTIWIFAIKKWATLERELDVNLDNVVLRKCGAPEPAHPTYPEWPTHPTHPVKPAYPTHPTHPVYPTHPTHPVYPTHPVKPIHPVEPPVGYCMETGGQAHVVMRGETLSGIAYQYGTTVEAIMHANGLHNANYIFVGQHLCIPNPKAAAYAPAAPTTVAPSAPPSPSPADGQPGPDTGGDAGNTYRVQRGDTLSGIAAQFGTTVEALMAANGLTNPNMIYAGQVLIIPG